MPESKMEWQTVQKVVTGVRNALELLTVQGARNANILAASCNDLDNLLSRIRETESRGGDKDGNKN